jgi:hypothetical protein
MQLCKASQAVENKIGFVTCRPKLVPHRDTTPTSQNREEGWRNDSTNQDILPHPQRVFMWNEIGRSVHEHHSLLEQG